MRFLTVFIVVLVFYGCEGQVDSSLDENDAVEAIDDKNILTEVITRTYSAKVVNDEPAIDTLQQIQSVTSDSEGKEIENTFYNLDMSISWLDLYIHDENGNKIGSDYYDKGKDNTIYYTYDIDSKGRRTFYQAYDKKTDALLFNGATMYNESGTKKRDGYVDEKGEFICTFEYQLDENGKELGYLYIDNLSGEKYPSSYKYVDYNDDDEWIKRYVVSDGKVQSIEMREFVKIETD
ncbi:MAG: hypothetical protein P8P74_09165 [Crocinitomicaceae bacterium]|nr:hypothetical protein [Crocinitomicaceae bacterium]